MEEKILNQMESLIMAEVHRVIHNQELPLTNLRKLLKQCLKDAKDLGDGKFITKDDAYEKSYGRY